MPLLTRPSTDSGTLPTRLLDTVLERTNPSQVAAGRAGLGALMIAQPSVFPRLLGVDSASTARMGWLVQMLGAREIALGAGTLVATRRDREAGRAWVAAGVLCDAVDAAAVTGAVLTGRVSRPLGALGVVTALGAMAIGLRGLRR